MFAALAASLFVLAEFAVIKAAVLIMLRVYM